MNPTHRSTWLRGGVLALALAAGFAQAAEMSVFKQPSFSGDALTLHGDNPNLAANGFQDQVSSVIVNSGRWEVCTQPNFQGDCAVLERGQYPALEQRLNHRIESAREVSHYANRDNGRLAYNEGARGGPAIELFDGPDFRGRRVPIARDQESLFRRDFDQQASSMVIHEGTWQICTRPGYEGVCRVFREGEYPDLRRFDNRIGSLKRVG
ncbi:MAG TPA: beta/gamma crystallin-related protein [Usitatibacter sp.]|nr:beta/gamma crystallin-related protein [Usitatibacter sp.]